jgi:LuxR family maltose regulon positive regulatory protein
MARLLYRAVERGITPDYVNWLLSAFEAEEQRSRGAGEKESSLAHLPPHSPALIESLSVRELEVLHSMAAGLKYKEIAGQLFISLNTVRHHTKNIYSKLNVNNRTQAIARAKELNLL